MADLLTQQLIFYDMTASNRATGIEIAVQPCESLRAELHDFVEAVSNNRSPKVIGSEAVKTLRLVTTVLDSIRITSQLGLQHAVQPE